MTTMPKNAFKAAILEGRRQIGLWCGIRDPAATEMLAACGFDWMAIDCEHAPNDVQGVLQMLQAMAPYPVSPIVRPTSLDVAEIKRLLDIGVQTLVVPYVQNVEEARLAAAAVDYPPNGIRGVAGATRASRFGTVPGYTVKAREEICLIVQVETVEALAALEDIAAVPGIDGIFIGPADLAASMGHPGDLKHPEVMSAILDGIRRIRAAGKPAGFLSTDQEVLEQVFSAGCTFAAVDIDMALLRRGAVSRVAACAHWQTEG